MTFADIYTSEPPGWPRDSNLSPWKIISLREASSDLNVSQKTLLKLFAEHNLMVVHLTQRKCGVLARDLAQLVQLRSRRA